MFGEECSLPMDVGFSRRDRDSPDPIQNPYALWVRDALEVANDQVRCNARQAVRRHKSACTTSGLFANGDCAALHPDVSGVATDVKLFDQYGRHLVHRYRIYKDPLHQKTFGICQLGDDSGPVD